MMWLSEHKSGARLASWSWSYSTTTRLTVSLQNGIAAAPTLIRLHLEILVPPHHLEEPVMCVSGR